MCGLAQDALHGGFSWVQGLWGLGFRAQGLGVLGFWGFQGFGFSSGFRIFVPDAQRLLDLINLNLVHRQSMPCQLNGSKKASCKGS